MEDHVRVCIVALHFSPSVGGSQVRTEKQARQLQVLGHDVTIITSRLSKAWKQTEMLGDLRVVRIGGIYRRGGELRMGRIGHLPVDIGLLVALWRLRHRYDIIHVFQLSSLSAVAVLIGRITHKPVIISIACEGPSDAQIAHLEQGATLMIDTLPPIYFPKIDYKDVVVGEINSLPKAVWGGSIVLDFLRKSNAFYQILSTRCHTYLTSHGFRPEQIVHIPGSVDTEKFRPAPERRPDQARPERDVICVARLEYSKGIDVLLHAWGRMLRAPAVWRAGLKPRLRIVGDGTFRPQMEHIASELGISESVQFLGLRTDIVDLLQPSWCFVLPSRWEGMPNALLEAMACGLPCVATRVSGADDLISDGVNGLLVEPEQPAEMAEALRKIIEDADLAQRLGLEGRATVVREYQLISIVEQCLDLYRRLIRNSINGSRAAEYPREMLLHASPREREGNG